MLLYGPVCHAILILAAKELCSWTDRNSTELDFSTCSNTPLQSTIRHLMPNSFYQMVWNCSIPAKHCQWHWLFKATKFSVIQTPVFRQWYRQFPHNLLLFQRFDFNMLKFNRSVWNVPKVTYDVEPLFGEWAVNNRHLRGVYCHGEFYSYSLRHTFKENVHH